MTLEESLNSKYYLKNVLKVNKLKFSVDFVLRNDEILPLIVYVNEKRFPFELPRIYIDISKQSFIPNKPHITSSGYICYLDEEGVIWSDDADLVIDFIFSRIDYILFSEESKEGIHREFQYYFNQVENKEYALSEITNDDYTKKIKLITMKDKSPLVFLNGDNINDEMKKMNSDKKYQINNVIYIPFSNELDTYVPNKEQFWNQKEISELIRRCVSEENIKKLEELTKDAIRTYYLLDIVLATKEKVLVGLIYTKKDTVHDKKNKLIPILECKEDFNITPIYIARIDDNKTLSRGGAITNGKEFDILVIGCGSIGSDIVFQLARSGFKNITLVDNDKLSEENIYRHFLGKNRGGKEKSKAKLLKIEFEKRYDEMNIVAFDKNIFSLLENGEIDLNKYSLVITAIGDMNKERLISKYILSTNTPIIYTWVEAYGIGGHAVLTNNMGKKGCYNCCIDKELNNVINFAGKSDKPYVKNFGGCLGTFTPYGGVDAMQTALLTVRLAHECLVDEIRENKIFSWKGDCSEFVKQGYTLSKAYYNFNIGFGERKEIKLEGCKYCESSN